MNNISNASQTDAVINDAQRAEMGRLKRQITSRLPGPLDLTGLADRKLAPLVFTLGRLGLLKHACGVLAATGGAGKGFFSLGIAASVACEDSDVPLFGIPRLPAPPQRGRVVLLSAEEPQEVLEFRVQALLKSIRESHGVRAVRSIEANLVVESLMGQAPCLVGKGGDDSTPTCQAWQEIVAEKVHRAMLFALDTASCFHRADENNNGEMTVLLQVCNRIAMSTNGSGILPHHSPKGSPGEVRGATAIANSARWVCSLVVAEDDPSLVSAHVSKENNTAPIKSFVLRREDGGILRGHIAPPITRRGPTKIPSSESGTARRLLREPDHRGIVR